LSTGICAHAAPNTRNSEVISIVNFFLISFNVFSINYSANKPSWRHHFLFITLVFLLFAQPHLCGKGTAFYRLCSQQWTTIRFTPSLKREVFKKSQTLNSLLFPSVCNLITSLIQWPIMQFSSRSAMLLKLLGSFFLRVELQHFSSPRRKVFVSAENVTCHRGDDFLSPRRRFLVTAEGRVFVDSEQGNTKEPLQWELQ
jgi:hypothetical protein